MAKVTNKELAIEVAKRIDEILLVCRLTLEGYAVLSSVKFSYLKSIASASKPAAVETVHKLSSAVGLPLSIFFDFGKPLSPKLVNHPALREFYEKNLSSKPEYFIIGIDPKKIKQFPKNDKGRLAYIVNETKYFDTARLIKDIIRDSKIYYAVEFESARLSKMLKSHLKVLNKTATTKLKKDGNESKMEVFEYQKKKFDV